MTFSSRILGTILRYEWLILVLVAVPMLFPRPEWTPLFLILPLLWVLHWRRSGSPFPMTPFNLPLLLLALMLLVSLWATFSIEFSLDKISGLLFSLAVFFAVVRFADRKFGLATVGFLAGGVAIAVLALLGAEWARKVSFLNPIVELFPSRLENALGPEGRFHPNVLAGAILWMLPLLLSLFVVKVFYSEKGIPYERKEVKWIWNTLIFIGFPFVCLIFLLTQSRGSWLAAILVLPAVFLSLIQGRRKKILIFIVLIITIGVAGTLFSAWLQSSSIQSFIIGTSGAFSVDTLNGRLELWSRAIYGIQDFSFTGMGMNTFQKVVHILYPLFTIGPDANVYHAHNTYLQAALDLGIPGLIAFLSIQIGALAMLVRTWRNRSVLPFSEPLSRAIILGLIGGMVASMLHGLVDAIIMTSKPGILWWYLLGLIAALYKLQVTGDRYQVTGKAGDSGQQTVDSRQQIANSGHQIADS